MSAAAAAAAAGGPEAAALLKQLGPLRKLLSWKTAAFGLPHLAMEGGTIPFINVTVPGINDFRREGQITGGGFERGTQMYWQGFKMGINPFDQVTSAMAHAIVTGVASESFKGDFADAMSEAIAHAVNKTGLDWEQLLKLSVTATRSGNETLAEFNAQMARLHEVANTASISIKTLADLVLQIQGEAGKVSGKSGVADAGTFASRLASRFHYSATDESKSLGPALLATARLHTTMGLRPGQVYTPGMEWSPEGMLAQTRGLERLIRQQLAVRAGGGARFAGRRGLTRFAAMQAASPAGMELYGSSDARVIQDFLEHGASGVAEAYKTGVAEDVRARIERQARAAEARRLKEAPQRREGVYVQGSFRSPPVFHPTTDVRQISQEIGSVSSVYAAAFALANEPREIVVKIEASDWFKQRFTAKQINKEQKLRNAYLGKDRSLGTGGAQP